MSITRRRFVQTAAAIGFGFGGLQRWVHGEGPGWTYGDDPRPGFGPLLDDPNRVFDLPDGFSYRVISKAGERMDDGLFVPARHDGMAAFPGPGGRTILVRNHENTTEPLRYGAFGWTNELVGRVDPAKLYDAGAQGVPTLGGTTTLVYDTKRGRLEKHFMSLAGTGRNCAGGPTPWNTWLTCEEWVQRADDHHARDHGYVFEVPARAEGGLTDPVPLKDMGRFNHEAVAVDPASSIVYLTEDRNDGLLYRFIPNRPGEMAAGGRLQALAVRDQPSLDMRNWLDEDGEPLLGPRIEVGRVMDVQWVDMEDVEAPLDDLRRRGFEQGAARFARGEGMWYGHESIYFACTSGGPKRLGQVWRYVPSPAEGTAGERERPGRLELFIQPADATLVQRADNLTVAPWGDLFVCEDGPKDDRLVRVTPDGRISTFARNRLNHSELAGATFSPDGSTLFVNMQEAGITLAITGPWRAAGA